MAKEYGAMPFFKKEVGEDGLETYVEVDDDAVLAETPAAQRMAEALKKANKEAKELRLAVKGKGDPNPDENTGGTPAPATPAAPVIDVDSLYETFRSRLTAEQQAAQQQEQARRDNLKAIAGKFKLKEDAIPLLEDSQNPERLAEHLAKTNYRFDDSAQGQDDPQATFQRQLKEIGSMVGLDGEEPDILTR
jgi:Fe-S cluster assembly iron-binding protein IscA